MVHAANRNLETCAAPACCQPGLVDVIHRTGRQETLPTGDTRSVVVITVLGYCDHHAARIRQLRAMAAR